MRKQAETHRHSRQWSPAVASNAPTMAARAPALTHTAFPSAELQVMFLIAQQALSSFVDLNWPAPFPPWLSPQRCRPA